MQQFDFSSSLYAEYAEPVSDRHFGSIYSTYFGLDAFEEQAELLGATGYRWPGGTRGETARDHADKDGDLDTEEYLYSLTQEDLITIDGKGLTDVMAAARSADVELSIFIPSIRYLEDPAQGAADVAGFLGKLLSGHYGELPRSLVLELGNETLDWTVERAEAYGILANRQLLAIRSVVDSFPGALPDIEVAVQIGRSAAEDMAIRNAMTTDALAMIDGLIAHHLPINMNNHNKILPAESDIDEGDSRYTRSIDYVEAWEKAVAQASRDPGIELDFLVSAWTVGPSSDFPSSLLDYQDIGARQGRTTVDTFVQLIASGADGAHVWGIDARSNPNYFSKPVDGVVTLSHGGQAFKMMAESLEGMRLMDGHVQSADADAWVYGFEDTEKYVLFAVANDLENSAPLSITLDNVRTDVPVEVVRLATEYTAGAPSGEVGADLRMYEVPIVSQDSFSIESGEFQFVLSEDFEVNRLTVWKEEIATSQLIDWNPLGAASNLFGGGLERTVVAGNDDHWALIGTERDDVIVDKAGDTLIKDYGGADQFVFRPSGGSNVIFDFEGGEGADEVLFYAFGYDSKAEARAHMSIVDEGVFFQDQDTSILFDGVTVSTIDEFFF